MTKFIRRRDFVAGSASAFGFLATNKSPLSVDDGLLANREPLEQQPVTLMSIQDSNMAGYDWTWNIRLIGLPNGSHSLSAIQFDNTGEEEDEPWQLDSKNEISNGRELLHSLHDMANEGFFQLWPDMLEQVAEKLANIDPNLGEEFRDEIHAYLEEWG